MADTKVSAFTELTTVTVEDLLHVINDPDGTPENRKLTIRNLFGKVPANTIINGTFVANTTSIRVASSSTPANSTATLTHGTISWDASYIYVTTSNNVTKRVALSSF